jgi:hypothetical protein
VTKFGFPAQVVILLLMAGFPAEEAGAGTLMADPGSASVGSFGLKVGVGKTCSEDHLVVPGPTVNSDQVACITITAADVEVVSPGAIFTAGSQITLDNLFRVALGAPFTAAIDSLVNSPFAWVQDDGPGSESLYNALFDLRLDDLALAPGEELQHFSGFSADGQVRFSAVLRWNPSLGENRIALFAWDDATGDLREHPSDFLIGSGFNSVQISWRAGPGNGEFLLSINGVPLSGFTDLINDSVRIDSVRWGAVDGSLVATTGSMDLDNFYSWR